jgi:hypothetical protein
MAKQEIPRCLAGKQRRLFMSPTVFRSGPFRFYFFSREEPRMHVHVSCGNAEAKFWLEPTVALAQNHGLGDRQIRDAQALVEAHLDECLDSWKAHFGR